MYFYELKEIYVDDDSEITTLYNTTKYSQNEFQDIIYKTRKELMKNNSFVGWEEIINVLNMDYGFKEIEYTGCCSFIHSKF